MQIPFRYDFKQDNQKRLTELKKIIRTSTINDLKDEKLKDRLYDKFKYPLVSYSKDEEKIKKEIILRIVPNDSKRGEKSQNGRRAIAVVQYWLPRASDSFASLEFRPEPYIADLSGELKSIKYDEDNIQFEIPTRYDKLKLSEEVIAEVKEKKKCVISYLDKNIENLNKNINSYNKFLEETIVGEIDEQLEELEEIEEIKTRL